MALLWPRILPLLDRPQRVARPRNAGQVDLWPLFLSATRTAAPPVASPGERATHTFGLVSLQRTRMRLLLRHTDGSQHVENRLALDFQFPC